MICCGATVLALVRERAGSALFGDAAAFVAALVVGGREASSDLLRRSALVFIVPGVLMLVPGSPGFESMLQLLADDRSAGSSGFDTFVSRSRSPTGLIVSTVILPAASHSYRPWP